MSHCQVKVPGKVMLAGEYTVLEGGPALACTVDRFLTVTIDEKPISGIQVDSTLWPETKHVTSATESVEPLLQSVAFAANTYGANGYHLSVDSDLDLSFGLGSSSACRLGALMGINNQ